MSVGCPRSIHLRWGYMTEEFRRVLKQLAADPVNLCCGYHICELCEPPPRRIWLSRKWRDSCPLLRKGMSSTLRHSLWRTTSTCIDTFPLRRSLKPFWHTRFSIPAGRKSRKKRKMKGVLNGRIDCLRWTKKSRHRRLYSGDGDLLGVCAFLTKCQLRST